MNLLISGLKKKNYGKDEMSEKEVEMMSCSCAIRMVFLKGIKGSKRSWS